MAFAGIARVAPAYPGAFRPHLERLQIALAMAIGERSLVCRRVARTAV